MTPDLRIQHAVVVRDGRSVRVAAQTADFDAAEAERIAVLFGERPAGVACPRADLACPFGTAHVAVVRVEDLPSGALGFRFLVLARELYKHLGDPFAVGQRYEVNWHASGPLEDLAWPTAVLPERTLEKLDAVLKAGDTPLLLGAAQALVDGNRVLLRRDAPSNLVSELWQLLPERTRCDLWPATFAFSDELGFHAAVGPTLPAARQGVRVLTEDAIRDYPQSSYELGLQLAIESGDRAALRKLLARRTSDDIIRLGLYILVLALVAAAVLKFVF